MSVSVEGVIVDSYEAGMNHLYEFAKRQFLPRYNYCLLMEEDDGLYRVVERLSMPCWGAFREYGCGTRPDDPWPGDLREPRHIFPKTGKVSAIAFINHGPSVVPGGTEERNRYKAEFILNPEVSPFRAVLKDFEQVIVKGEYNGLVIKDCNFEPTILAVLLRVSMHWGSSLPRLWCEYMDQMKEPNPYVAFIKTYPGGYGMSGRMVLERFFLAQPFPLTNGTLYERESYNRPDRDYLFGGKDNVGVVAKSMSEEELLSIYHKTMEGDIVIAA